MLVSFLVFGQIFTFLVTKYLLSILHIFGPIYRLVIPTFFKFVALMKLRVSISLWFYKELLEFIGCSVAFIKTYQSDLHHRLWRSHIYQGSSFHLSNGSRLSIQADTRAILPS